jgi:hypothetical protein
MCVNQTHCQAPSAKVSIVTGRRNAVEIFGLLSSVADRQHPKKSVKIGGKSGLRPFSAQKIAHFLDFG